MALAAILAAASIGSSIYDNFIRKDPEIAKPEVPNRAWEMVNSKEFTQMRRHGYGRTYLDDAVRAAVSGHATQARHTADQAKSAMHLAGMQDSGLGGAVESELIANRLGIAMQARGQAWDQSEKARNQAVNQYYGTMAQQDQMTYQRDYQEAMAEEQRRRMKPSFFSTMISTANTAASAYQTGQEIQGGVKKLFSGGDGATPTTTETASPITSTSATTRPKTSTASRTNTAQPKYLFGVT